MKKNKISNLIVVVIVCILFIGGWRIFGGWRPFATLESSDLYYVGRISYQDTGLLFFEEGETVEITRLLRELKVFPTLRKWDAMGGLNSCCLVFEYADKQGDMTLIKFWQVNAGMPNVEQWVTINDKIYKIDENTYRGFVDFLKSYSS